MKCYNCGADLTDDTIFCSYCGVNLEQYSGNNKGSENNAVSDESKNNNADNKQDQPIVSNEKSFTDKGKTFISNFWQGLDLFCKVAVISIIVVVLLLLISLGAGKGLSIFLSIVQLAGLISALLIHKDSINLNKKWVKYIVLGVSILLTISTLMSFSFGTKNENKATGKATTYTNQTEEQVIVPVNSPYGYDDCIDKDYSAIKADFELSGFTNISTESVEDLNYTESDKLYTIESISINGNADFTKNQEFKIDDKVIIRYHEYRQFNVKLNIEFTGNWIFNKYDVNVLLDDDKLDTLSHGTDKTLDFSVIPGEHIISFVSTDSSTVKGEMSLTIDCDLEAAYKIYCNTDDISVESLYIDRLTELSENEVKIDKPVSDYCYKNYKETEDSLKTLGFTNIEFNVLYDIVFGWTTEGSVDSVSIDGNNDFKRGDVFSKDAHIIITYHMKEEDDPSRPEEGVTTKATSETSNILPYSTNDRETAKNGDTGVFSYKSNGMTYDIYWIIDFDEGYVFYFTEGNGEETCDRLKIESGTLNDYVTITYHDGDDEWSNYLHFHYVNQPDTLIMVDNDGFEYKYLSTDLEQAFKLRDSKRIKDY